MVYVVMSDNMFLFVDPDAAETYSWHRGGATFFDTKGEAEKAIVDARLDLHNLADYVIDLLEVRAKNGNNIYGVPEQKLKKYRDRTKLIENARVALLFENEAKE